MSIVITFYVLCIMLLCIQQGFCQKGCVFMWENGTELTEEAAPFGVSLNQTLDTDQPGKSLIVLKTENVAGITSTTIEPDNKGPYIKTVLTNDTFTITLAENFLDYEEYEIKDLLFINVAFNCISGSPRNLRFLQPIIDTNNHYPEFLDAPYTYTLSMPFPKNIPIDLFGAITARDIDITNKMITFSLDKNDSINHILDVAWTSTNAADTKRHLATLKTKALINLATDVTFNLHATDSGTPPNTNTTTVTIVIDKTDSVLRFAKPIYFADYTDLDPLEANGTIFKFREGNITLSGGSDKSIDYNLREDSGEYQKNFQLDISPDRSLVHLVLFQPPDKLFNESFALLILTAKKPGAEESTVLHISLPGRSTSKVSSTTEPATSESPTSTPGSSGLIIKQPCDCTDCKVTVIVLSIFLAAVSTGLITTIIVTYILKYRARRLLPKVSEKTNGFQRKRAEMAEIQRDSNGSSPVDLQRRSVSFNDTIEEITVARL